MSTSTSSSFSFISSLRPIPDQCPPGTCALLSEFRNIEQNMASIDLLSSLPDDVIFHILSFLPTKLSMATSVLGKRWRLLWAYVPSLHFSGRDDFRKEGTRFSYYFRPEETRASDIIHRVILRHKTKRIDYLTLYRIKCSEYQLETLITTAIDRNIRDLYLELEFDTIPRSLFNYKTIVDLTLRISTLSLSAVDNVSLPSLKKFRVSSNVVCENDDALPHFLFGCPSLEELNMAIMFDYDYVGCINVSSPTIKTLKLYVSYEFDPAIPECRMIINAPALRYLRVDEYALECITIPITMISLVDADICLLNYSLLDLKTNYNSTVKFLHSLCYAKCLKISDMAIWRAGQDIAQFGGSSGLKTWPQSICSADCRTTADDFDFDYDFEEGLQASNIIHMVILQHKAKRMDTLTLYHIKCNGALLSLSAMDNVSLPSLKKFYVSNVVCENDDALPRFLSGYLSLEELNMAIHFGYDYVGCINISSPTIKTLKLNIDHLFRPSSLEYKDRMIINAQALRYLQVYGYAFALECITIPITMISLVEADIRLKKYWFIHVKTKDNSMEMEVKFLHSLCYVKCLKISCWEFEKFVHRGVACSTVKFDNLAKLEVELQLNFKWSLLVKFLEIADNLEVLILCSAATQSTHTNHVPPVPHARRRHVVPFVRICMEKSRRSSGKCPKLSDGEENMASIDRLSSLPDVVICHILSFLPTKRSVATSILGKRWRFLWAHVPCLHFSGDNVRQKGIRASDTINRVIFRHKAKRLDTLTLCDLNCNEYQLETWITTAIDRSIRNLYLKLKFETFPRSLFNCKTIVKLKLENYSASLSAVKNVSLPSLKKLYVHNLVCENDDALPCFLSGCPSLRILNMIFLANYDYVGCINISSPTIMMLQIAFKNSLHFDYRMIINSPALRYLQVNDYDLECITIPITMISLVKADIRLKSYRALHLKANYNSMVVKFLHSLCYVKCLKISGQVFDKCCSSFSGICTYNCFSSSCSFTSKRSRGKFPKLSDGKQNMASIDRLSSLPDVVICYILSFLPTKCSVATSVLGKRWRFLWAHLPCLDFSGDNFRKKRTQASDIINRVIFLHKAKIMDTLTLDCINCNEYQLETWIMIAIDRSIRNLYLQLDLDTFPRSLFNCKTIVNLKLENKRASLSAVKNVSLPSLKKFYVHNLVCENDDALPRFLSGCPSLEDLKMGFLFEEDEDYEGCINISSTTIKMLQIDFNNSYHWEYRVIINAPALRYLRVDDYDLECITIPISIISLVDADICLINYSISDLETNCNSVAKFLHSLCYVRCLTISGWEFDERISLFERGSDACQLYFLPVSNWLEM
ncbi:F-box/RNI-like/FBD-like domains-containing protein, partial [Striga asiatica]